MEDHIETYKLMLLCEFRVAVTMKAWTIIHVNCRPKVSEQTTGEYQKLNVSCQWNTGQSGYNSA